MKVLDANQIKRYQRKCDIATSYAKDVALGLSKGHPAIVIESKDLEGWSKNDINQLRLKIKKTCEAKEFSVSTYFIENDLVIIPR